VQALDMPIHQGKMHAEYTTDMWSDAGVGVEAQRIIMIFLATNLLLLRQQSSSWLSIQYHQSLVQCSIWTKLSMIGTKILMAF
jgi:hypothetical protein